MSSRSKRGRRRNRCRFSLLFKLLAGAALVAALTFGATVFFQVEHILIAGNSRYTAQEVEEASGIQLGDNLFRLNKGQISEDIRRKLPYVEELTIVRHLPSTIAIEIREWDAVASILPSSGTSTAEAPAAEEAEDTELPEETGTAAGEAWLISVGGRLLEPAPEDSTALTVTGLTVLSPQAGTQMAVPQAEETRRQGLMALLAALEERGTLEKVSSIDLSAGTEILLRYDGRFDVKLPISGDFIHKLRALEAVVEKRESYETGTMDLTRQDYDVVFSPG